MSFKLKIAAVVGALFLATSANAATCTVNNIAFTLAGATSATCVSGDDLRKKGIVATNMKLFDIAGWAVGDSTNTKFGDGRVAFAAAPKVKASSGSWSVGSSTGLGALMIVLKANHNFGAFLLDAASASLAGSWGVKTANCTTAKCEKRKIPLYQASVYYTEQPAAVPVPAAGLLLLGGIAALAGFRRFRKAA